MLETFLRIVPYVLMETKELVSDTKISPYILFRRWKSKKTIKNIIVSSQKFTVIGTCFW